MCFQWTWSKVTLGFEVTNLMSSFHCLGQWNGSFETDDLCTFLNILVINTNDLLFPHPIPSWRTTHYRLSAIIYSIYSWCNSHWKVKTRTVLLEAWGVDGRGRQRHIWESNNKIVLRKRACELDLSGSDRTYGGLRLQHNRYHICWARKPKIKQCEGHCSSPACPQDVPNGSQSWVFYSFAFDAVLLQVLRVFFIKLLSPHFSKNMTKYNLFYLYLHLFQILFNQNVKYDFGKGVCGIREFEDHWCRLHRSSRIDFFCFTKHTTYSN